MCVRVRTYVYQGTSVDTLRDKIINIACFVAPKGI